MASRRFILDEWILHDLLGDNGPGHQNQALSFLVRLVSECDHIARSQPSPWTTKAYALMEYTDEIRRGLSRFLQTSVLLDPNKCQTFAAEDLIPLPEEIRLHFDDSDKYLGDLFNTMSAEVILTTDAGVHLAGQLSNGRVRVRFRDEFLAEYLG